MGGTVIIVSVISGGRAAARRGEFSGGGHGGRRRGGGGRHDLLHEDTAGQHHGTTPRRDGFALRTTTSFARHTSHHTAAPPHEHHAAAAQPPPAPRAPAPPHPSPPAHTHSFIYVTLRQTPVSAETSTFRRKCKHRHVRRPCTASPARAQEEEPHARIRARRQTFAPRMLLSRSATPATEADRWERIFPFIHTLPRGCSRAGEGEGGGGRVERGAWARRASFAPHLQRLHEGKSSLRVPAWREDIRSTD